MDKKNMSKTKRGGGYRKLTYIFLATTILFATCFSALWIKGDYTLKLLTKVGILSEKDEQNQQRSDYWTCHSWQECLKQMDVDADICFFGDSITNATDFQGHFQNKMIVNLGLSGDSLNGMIQRIETVKSVKPEVVFVEGGINGFKSLGISETVNEYESLLNGLKESLPEADIYVQGIFPISKEKENEYGMNADIQKADSEIKELCEEMQVTYIDIYSEMVDEQGNLTESYTIDGVHLNDDGKEVWLSALDKYIV